MSLATAREELLEPHPFLISVNLDAAVVPSGAKASEENNWHPNCFKIKAGDSNPKEKLSIIRERERGGGERERGEGR